LGQKKGKKLWGGGGQKLPWIIDNITGEETACESGGSGEETRGGSNQSSQTRNKKVTRKNQKDAHQKKGRKGTLVWQRDH